VVDATQGVQAQTVANTYLALEKDLEIIPVLNKVDLPSADVDGMAEMVEEVVHRIRPPKGDPTACLRALIFDSWYDSYRGAMVMVRVFDGTLRLGDKVRFMATSRDYEVTELGS